MEFADGSTRFTAYDTASDVITYTDENGSVFNNIWDCLGRKTNVAITPASGIGGTTSQTFQYDGLNRPTLNQDITSGGTVQVSFVYDSLGRSIEESPITLGTGSRYVTNTAFTSMPATQFEYPNNRLVNSNYDVLYRRKQVIEQATGAVVAAWQFYGPGRIAEVVLANGLACTYLNNARTNSSVQSPTPVNPSWGNNSSDRLGYDGAGRNITKRYVSSTLNAQNGYANTTALVGNTTAYDRSGNKFYERALQAEERDNLYQPVSSAGAVASPMPGYDSVNRLLQYQRGALSSTGGYENAGGGSVTTAITLPNTDQSRNYKLDGLGNWKTSTYTPVGGSATTDQRNHNYVNEITQRTLTGSSPVVFQYDGSPGASNGNLANDGTLIYSYDALNRPIQIINEGLVIATYVYDAMNRRVRKTVSNGGLPVNIPNGTTDYIWQGSQVMEERNPFGGSGSTDTPIRQYIWGTYIDECIQLTTLVTLGAQNLPAGTYYLCQDLLYRAVALTNSSGTVVEAYDTDAYGNTIIFTGPGTDGVWFTDDDTQSNYGANEIIYCGYRYDPETELYYVRNRTYSPVLGRWLQRDPIGYAGGINLYEYVSGRSAIALDANGTTPSNKQQCCQKRQGNCCGADITDQLITMARQIQMVWNALPHFFKKVLARWTVIPPFAINAWGIHGMAIGGAPLTQAGTGKCVGTVTVAGNCYQEGTVNYWLAGLIYRALDSSWEFAPYAKLFEYEVAVYPIIPGLASGSPIVQKWYWWAAGTVGNPTAVPPPRKFRDCVPNAVQNKLPLSWYWGFLRGQS